MGMPIIKINQRTIPNFRGYIRPIIQEFVEVLEENFDDKVCNNFYRNVQSLKLTKKKHMPAYVAGIFDSKKNEIIYGEEDLLDDDGRFTIIHELFHMTSCQYGNVGFHDKYLQGGVGINEGFTELLTRKYFGCSDNDCSYLVETSVASVLASIIGEEKMTNLYMEGNYFGLLIALDTYLDSAKISDFFHKLDHFTALTSKSPFILKLPFVDHTISTIMKDLSSSLANMYIRKNKNVVQNISFEDKKEIRKLYFQYENLIHQYNPYHLEFYHYSIQSEALSQYFMNLRYNFDDYFSTLKDNSQKLL